MKRALRRRVGGPERFVVTGTWDAYSDLQPGVRLRWPHPELQVVERFLNRKSEARQYQAN